MNFNIKKEKRYQYFAPDNASTIPFSIALNNHITYLNKKFEDLGSNSGINGKGTSIGMD